MSVNRIDIKIKRLTETAIIPTYGSNFAAGADLYADIKEPIFIDFGHIEKISTGIAIEIPDGYVGLLYARSGLATKHGLAPANKVGVIDSDYRGPVISAIQGCEPYDKEKESWQEYIERHTIHPGDRIAQIVITPYYQAVFEETDNLDSTERGSGGFGSTGTN
jgi:dUTP pyrophosphatase